jgi:hypothetical protein
MSVPPKVRVNSSLFLASAISVVKLKPTAEPPFKEDIKNIAFEITIIERVDNRADDVYGDVNDFSTGLILNAPKHYHIEIIEHPALHKTGYMLVGGPRIINPDNTEELILPLYKFKESEDLELPFRAAQLVLRETEYSTLSTDTLKGGYDRDDDRYQEERRPQGRGAPGKPGRGGASFHGQGTRASKTMGRGGNHMF